MKDLVKHPAHYMHHSSGIECKELTENMNAPNLANVLKYAFRCGKKGDSLDDEIQDTRKMAQYCEFEISRVRRLVAAGIAIVVADNALHAAKVQQFLKFEKDPLFAMIFEADMTEGGNIGLLSKILSVLVDRVYDLQDRNPWRSVDEWIEENRVLVNAIIQVESAGRDGATRFEKGYKYLWNVKDDKPYRFGGGKVPADFYGINGVTASTEFMQQRTSWGAMQVMGAVAREYDFKGDLPELCGLLGIRYGAMHLMNIKNRLESRGQFREKDLIAAYNYGHVRMLDANTYANQGYVDKVTAAMGVAA